MQTSLIQDSVHSSKSIVLQMCVDCISFGFHYMYVWFRFLSVSVLRFRGVNNIYDVYFLMGSFLLCFSILAVFCGSFVCKYP